MHRLPTPAFHVRRRCAGILVPARIIVINEPVRFRTPRELWHPLDHGAKKGFTVRRRSERLCELLLGVFARR